MKLNKPTILTILTLTSAYAFALEFCQFTANSACHDASDRTFDCSSPGVTVKEKVSTAGQSYNHCSMIGLGGGNTGCQNDGDPFCCRWTEHWVYCDNTEVDLVSPVCVDPPTDTQPTTAAGGDDCNP